MNSIKKAVAQARKNATPNIVDVHDVLLIDSTLDREKVKDYLRANLSSYELSCGYVQTLKKGENYIKLYKEHNTFHVVLNSETAAIKKDWLTFDTLSDARKAFSRLKKFIV